MALFTAACGPYDRGMNWLRVWWRGPVGADAWRYSADQYGTHVRVWPVCFSDKENFESFLDSLKLEMHGSGCPEPPHVSIRSDSYMVKAFPTVDEFLVGKSRSALRNITLDYSHDAHLGFNPVGHSPVNLEIKFRVRSRGDGDEWYVSVSSNSHSERDGFPKALTKIEELIEAETSPITRLGLWKGKSVVERDDVVTVEQRQRDIQTRFWAWGGSALISFAVAALSWFLDR